MKRLLTIVAICAINPSIAQVPNIINFQAQAVNNDGSIISNQAIKTRLSILDTPTGVAVYSEVHSVTTSSAGLIGVGIGNGSIENGDFYSIKWEEYPKYIKVEIDLLNGAGYKLVSTSQLVTVPYSFFSAKADTSLHDSDNQELIVIGNQISISNGNSVNIPSQWTTLTSDPNLLGIKFTDGKTGEYEFSNGTPTLGGVSVGLTVRNKKEFGGSWSFLSLESSSLTSSRSKIDFKNPIGHYSIETQDTTLLFYHWRGNGGTPILQYRPDLGFLFQQGFVTPLGLNSTRRLMLIGESGNIGIGDFDSVRKPKSKLQIQAGDVYIDAIGTGVILKSPNGGCWRVTIDDSGNLVKTAITCP